MPNMKISNEKYTEVRVISIYKLTSLIRELVPEMVNEEDPFKKEKALTFFEYLIDDLEYMVINHSEDFDEKKQKLTPVDTC